MVLQFKRLSLNEAKRVYELADEDEKSCGPTLTGLESGERTAGKTDVVTRGNALSL
jgi:hypothetical protein